MLSRLRKRATYTNVALTLALVFAMTGGAYAAKKYIITSTSQIKPSVLKQLQAKRGPAGPTGAPGLAGAAGKDGSPGEKGPEGKRGEQGEPGAKGTTGPSGPTGPHGPTGPTGQTGYTETLPKGKTETGVWATSLAQVFNGSGARGAAAISFNIPLAVAPTLVYVTEEEESHAPECAGTASAPTAEEGFLCIYTSQQFLSFLEEAEASKVGALLTFGAGELNGHVTYGAIVHGTWAVTAE